MRCALIGDHGDGRAFAQAAVATGRYELAAYCGTDTVWAGQHFPTARVTVDVEDILADPKIEACIVAVPIEKRLEVTRRVLQSERHALVVHPVDLSPVGAYELDMLRGDTHQVLLPLICEHIGVDADGWTNDSPYIFEMTVADKQVSLEHGEGKQNPALPCWTLLRHVGGEIVEVQAFAAAEEVIEDRPLVVLGRFYKGGMFQVTFQPAPNEPDETKDDAPWTTVVEEFEKEVAFINRTDRAEPAAGGKERLDALLSWRDEVRALELDDAADRSLHKRRAQLMEYQEANEEVGFKGTMTLVGCAILWIAIMLLIASAWWPWAGYLILPAIVVFLGMQLLRFVVK